jgi:hypothetical protein
MAYARQSNIKNQAMIFYRLFQRGISSQRFIIIYRKTPESTNKKIISHAFTLNIYSQFDFIYTIIKTYMI